VPAYPRQLQISLLTDGQEKRRVEFRIKEMRHKREFRRVRGEGDRKLEAAGKPGRPSSAQLM
jgi:hypothetical protein